MSTLIFQHSRRQLIASMLTFVDEYDTGHEGDQSHAHGQDELQGNSGDVASGSPSHHEKHKALVRAIKAADTQFENMEYWSDIREAERRGESMGTAEKVVERDPPAGPAE